MTASTQYDYIIAGGGCAGLALVHTLLQQLASCRILLIDQERKNSNDRTWCFWHLPNPPYASLVSHQWSQIEIRNMQTSICTPVAPYAYHMIRGIDFYRHTNAIIDADTRVTRIYGRIERIGDVPRHHKMAEVIVEGAPHYGTWVFDSTFDPRALVAAIPKNKLLLQHFYGQVIECERECFAPHIATLFDFRTSENNDMQFIYRLPLSPTRALIEFTAFTPQLYQKEYYRRAIRTYIADHLQNMPYRVIEDEEGIIPMTAHMFPRRLGNRVMAIGTKGGRVKASTGFAFLRIQQDAARIAALLQRGKPPTRISSAAPIYRLMDAMIIDVLVHHPRRAQEIFFRLFARNPIHRVFTVLDECASLKDIVRLMASMPRGIFIASFFRVLFR